MTSHYIVFILLCDRFTNVIATCSYHGFRNYHIIIFLAEQRQHSNVVLFQCLKARGGFIRIATAA